MTKEEFEAIEKRTALPIKLASGRMGLCSYWNNKDILVDAYTGNDCVQIPIRFGEVIHLRGGVLQQLGGGNVKQV